MIVTVTDRKAMSAAWGSPGLFRVLTKTIEIADTCPKCGGPRGEPKRVGYCEDGVHYTVHNWTNPCDHVDMYEAVLAEATNVVEEAAA